MARRPDPAALLSAAAGLLLVALSSLSLMGAIQAQPAATTLSALRSHQPVEAKDAAAAAFASQRAAGWFEPSRYLTDAALARSASGRPDDGAIAAQALAATPASPHNWARLAIARHKAGDGAGAMRAWEMSVLTGRYVPGLMIVRLDMGFRLLASAGPAQVELLGDQVRLLAALDLAGLAELAARRNAEPFVRAALSSTPDLLTAYAAADHAARG